MLNWQFFFKCVWNVQKSQITPYFSSRRADAVGAGAWATAAVWLMGTETGRARTVSLMYINFFTTCFHTCFIVFTTICWLWFSGSHIFIQRRWLCTNWPHAGSHFPSRTNGKQQIPLSIETSPSSSLKMLKQSQSFDLTLSCQQRNHWHIISSRQHIQTTDLIFHGWFCNMPHESH